MTRRRAAIVLVPVAGLVTLWLAPDLSRYPVADPAAVFLDSLFYSGSAIVLVLALVVSARLGAPTFARDVAVAVVASLVVVPIGYAAVVFCNGRLDTGPATEHTVRLVRAAADGRLEVESWRGSGDVQRLPRRWRAAAAAPGSVVTVTTRSGWLGHEWVTAAAVIQ